MSKLLWLGFLLVSASALCDESCLTCGADGTCQACAPNANLQSGSCVCASGTYPRATVPLSCGVCSSTCQTCSGPSEFECTSCPPETVTVGPTPSRCVCATDPSRDLCSSCYQTCSQCDYAEPDVCTACVPGFEMYNGYCVPTLQFSQLWTTYSYYYSSINEQLRPFPNNRREQATYYLTVGSVRELSDLTVQVTFPGVYVPLDLYGISCVYQSLPTFCVSDGANTVKIHVPLLPNPDAGHGLYVNKFEIRNVTNPDIEGGTGEFYVSIIDNRKWRDDARTVIIGSNRFYSREYGRYEDWARMQGQQPYETLNLDTQVWKVVNSKRDLETQDFNVPFGALAIGPQVQTLLSGEVSFAGSQEMGKPTELEFSVLPGDVLRSVDKLLLTLDPNFYVDSTQVACVYVLADGTEAGTGCVLNNVNQLDVSAYSGSISDLGAFLTVRVTGVTNPPFAIAGNTQFRAEIYRRTTVLERLDIQGPELLPGNVTLVLRTGTYLQGGEISKATSQANITIETEHWVPAGGSIQFGFDELERPPAADTNKDICYVKCYLYAGAVGLNGGNVECGRYDQSSYVLYNFEAIAPGTQISVSMYVRERATDFTGNLISIRTLDANNHTIDVLRTEGVRKKLDLMPFASTTIALNPTSATANATSGVDVTFTLPADLLDGSTIKVTLPMDAGGFNISDKLDCYVELTGSLYHAFDCSADNQQVTVDVDFPLFAGYAYKLHIRGTKGGCLGQFRNPMIPGCYDIGFKVFGRNSSETPLAVYQTAVSVNVRLPDPQEAEVFLWNRDQSGLVLTSTTTLSLPTIWTIYYTPVEALESESYVAFMFKNIDEFMDANDFRNSYCFRNETEVLYTNATLDGFAPAPSDMKAYLLYGVDQSAAAGVDTYSGFKFLFPSGLPANGTYRFDVLGVAGNGNLGTELWLAVWRFGDVLAYGSVSTLSSYFQAGANTWGTSPAPIDYTKRNNDLYFAGEVANITFTTTTLVAVPVINMYLAVALPSGFVLTPSATITITPVTAGTPTKELQHVTSFNSPQYSLIWGWTDGTVNMASNTNYAITVSGVQIPYDKCSSPKRSVFYAGKLGSSSTYSGLIAPINLYFNRSEIAPEDIELTLGAANEVISNFAIAFPVSIDIPWNGFITIQLHQGFIFDYVQECGVTGLGNSYLCTLNSIQNIINITDFSGLKANSTVQVTLDKVRMPNTAQPIELLNLTTYGCCSNEGCSGLETTKYFTVQLSPAVPTYSSILKVQYFPVNVGYPGDVLVVFKLTHELLPRSRVILALPINNGIGDLSSVCRVLNMTGETWQITPTVFTEPRPKYLVSYTSCVADAVFVNITFSQYIPPNAILGLYLSGITIPSAPVNFWPGLDPLSPVPAIRLNFSVSSESYNKTVDQWSYNPDTVYPSVVTAPVNYTFEQDCNRPLVTIDPLNSGEFKTFTFAFTTQRDISPDEVLVIEFGSASNWFNQIYLYTSLWDHENFQNCWSERVGAVDCQMTGRRVYIHHHQAFQSGELLAFLVRRRIPNEVAITNLQFTVWSVLGDVIAQAFTFTVPFTPTPPPAFLDTVGLNSSSSVPGAFTNISLAFNFGSYRADLDIVLQLGIRWMYYQLQDQYDCQLLNENTQVIYSSACFSNFTWLEPILRLRVPQNYLQVGGLYQLTIFNLQNPNSASTYPITTLFLYNPATMSKVAKTYSLQSTSLTWSVNGPGNVQLLCDQPYAYFAMTAGAVSPGIWIYSPTGFFGSTVKVEAVVRSILSGTRESYKFHLRDPVVIESGSLGAYAYIVAEDNVTLSQDTLLDYYITWSIFEESSLATSLYTAPGDTQLRVGSVLQNVTVSPTNFVPLGGDSLPLLVKLTASPATALTVSLSTPSPWLIPFPSQLVFGPSDLYNTFILSADSRLAPGDYQIQVEISGPQYFNLLTQSVTVTVLQFGSVPGTVSTSVVVISNYVEVTQARTQPGVGYFMVAPAGSKPLTPKELIQAAYTGVVPVSAIDNVLSDQVLVFRVYGDSFSISGLTPSQPYVLYGCLVNAFGLPGPISATNFTADTAPRYLVTTSVLTYVASDSSSVVQQATALSLGAKTTDFALLEVVESNQTRFGLVTNFTYYLDTNTFGDFNRTPNLDYLSLAAPDLSFAGVYLTPFTLVPPQFLRTPQVSLTLDTVEVTVLLDSLSVLGIVLSDFSPLTSFQVLHGLTSDNTEAYAALQTKATPGQEKSVQLQRPSGNFTVWIAAENDIPFYPMTADLTYSFSVIDGVVN